MPEDLQNNNSQKTLSDQPSDPLLDIPELPEEPHNITLEDIAKPKPTVAPKIVPKPVVAGEQPIKILKNTNKFLPQSREQAIKPLILEPQKIVQTPSAHISHPTAIAQTTAQPSKLKIILIYLGFAVGAVLFVYLFINFPALWSKISYRFFGNDNNLKQNQIIDASQANDDLLFLNTVYNYPPKKYIPSDLEEIVSYENAQQLFSQTNYGYNDIVDNEIIINKIGVRAPIVWDVPTEDATLMDNLRYGVVHYKGTAKPGELAADGKGNVFIAGHSSYYWWDDGQYKTVFANLDGLSNGDEIIIKYNNYYFLYKVIDKKVVNPDEVGVLAQNTDKPVLTLMTCVPVGTDAQRLIVTSERVGIGKVGN